MSDNQNSSGPAGSGGEPAPERLSALLARLAARQQESIALGTISRTLKDRGFGALMIMLAAPNLVPTPPGASTVLGLPLIFVATQLIIGYRKPLLPARLRSREIRMDTLRGIVERIAPWVRRFERVARPRWWLLPQRQAEQLVGAVAVLLALVLILPIPFGNFLPGLAIILLCLGLGERDGLWTGAGLLVGLGAIGAIAGLVGSAALALLNLV